MKTVRLGERGPLVTRLALGTMTFGLRSDEATSRRILDTGLDAGITLIDTADVYPYAGDLSTVGMTETLLGYWLRGKRDKVVLATKVGGQVGPGADDAGNTARHIHDAVDASLRRLGTDSVDLLQLHGFDARVPVEETAGALAQLVKAGKAHYVGVSNFQAVQVRDLAAAGAPITVQQPRYSLLARGIEREILPSANDLGIGTLVYNPLAGGMLSGAHRRGAEPHGRFAFGRAAATYRERYWHDETFDALEAIAEVAESVGLAMPVLAMAWLLAQNIDSAIVGASAPEHVTTAVSALAVDLSPELLARLDEITSRFVLTEGVNAGLPRR